MSGDPFVESVRTPIEWIARDLVREFGPTLVAFMTKSRARTTPYRWINLESPPKSDAAQRLRFAYRVWLTLLQDEDAGTARAWFIGANPRLSEESPAAVIRDGRWADVLAAVSALREGQFS